MNTDQSGEGDCTAEGTEGAEKDRARIDRTNHKSTIPLP